MQQKDELECRKLVVEYGIKLLKAGLVQGTWGNISIKLDDKHMLCTPSGIDYERLTPEDIVKVNYHTMEFEDNIKPTSEKGLHAGIYKRRPEAGAVIHTHSKYCSIFAACHMPLQIENPESIERIGEIINIADYGFPGTNKITRKIKNQINN